MKRRDFLKAVPVAAGAVLLLPAYATPLQKASFRGKTFYFESCSAESARVLAEAERRRS